MKKRYLTFLLSFLLVGCGSSEKVFKEKEFEAKAKVNENTKNEVTESIEVMDENGKTIGETDTIESAKQMLVEHNKKKDTNAISKAISKDSLGFHQELRKRTGPLHFLYNELLEANVSENGNVNYKQFKKSHEQLLGYISVLQQIYPKIDSVLKTREQKLAYWINTYNALTIDLILRNYPLNSIKDIKDPWDQRLWKFGDKWLNLNHIEHNILRKMDEPRIHFAIVCASFSCPKLQNEAFTASKLDEQLTKATKEFLNDSERNKISENTIQLSKIFKWFAKDFKADGSLIDWLNKYSDVEISSKAKKSFLDYNWDLND